MWPLSVDMATLTSGLPMAHRPPAILDDLPTTLGYPQARERGLSDRRLRDLVDTGALLHLGRGLYRKADAPFVDVDFLEIAHRSPDATLCLLTALSRHELTDQIPRRIDVALPRTRRPPQVRAPVQWHRFDERTFTVGRGGLTVEAGISLGIYSPERCIVDAFRLRHMEGEELAVEALRRWLRRPGSTPAALLGLARAFPKAEPALRDALRILL